MSKKTKTTNNLKFEAALSELEAINEKLECGETDLDESLQLFEDGMKLAKFCEDKLNNASTRVQKIIKDFSGHEKLTDVSDAEITKS